MDCGAMRERDRTRLLHELIVARIGGSRSIPWSGEEGGPGHSISATLFSCQEADRQIYCHACCHVIGVKMSIAPPNHPEY